MVSGFGIRVPYRRACLTILLVCLTQVLVCPTLLLVGPTLVRNGFGMRVSGTVSEVVPKNPLDVSKTSFHVPTTTLGVSNTRSGWSRNSEFGYRIGGLGGPNTRLLIHPFRVCICTCVAVPRVSGMMFRDSGFGMVSCFGSGTVPIFGIQDG